MGMALHEIQARRVSLLELIAESNEVGVQAVHAIMQEPNAFIQFGEDTPARLVALR